MRIALFPSAFHPSLGGVEELTRQLALAHQRAGHDVIVITERWPRELPAMEVFEGIPVQRYPMRVPAECWRSKVSYTLTHRFIRSQVESALRRFRPDVLHVQCVSSTTWYALRAQRSLGVPLLVTLQGELTMDAGGIFQKSRIAQTIMHTALEKADFVTACSRHTLQEAEDFHGQSLAARSAVIPNGISIREFEESEPRSHRRPYVFAIGRHVPQKGFDMLLEAWTRVGECGFDLLLAGDGPEHLELHRRAQHLGIADRVVFLGRTNRSETASLFKGCEFFVLPSRHEPFGIVNLEAMVAGKAVLATATGGVPEFVEDGCTGLLVRPETGELVEGLHRLIRDPQVRRAMGQCGRARVKNFDWDKLAEDYQLQYRKMSRPWACDVQSLGVEKGAAASV